MTATQQSPQIQSLRDVRRQLARWRQIRPHSRAPIPAALWAAAVALARQHGLYQTARALPISYGALKAQVARADAAGAPTFVELTPRPPRSGPECVIEFHAPLGTTRVRVTGLALSEVVTLTRALGSREA